MFFNKIKSNIIIKLVFSFIYEAKKLKLLRQNKRLRKILNINFYNYFLWGKRLDKKIDKDGYGRIFSYVTHDSIFEGEFKNNKKCSSLFQSKVMSVPSF